MKQILILFLTLLFSLTFQAQNLDRMSETKRNETLLRIAKDIVMEYGPDYYREYKAPEIAHGIVGGKGKQVFTDEELKKYRNRSFYTVKYLFDRNEEAFPWDYSAYVFIWGDTGQAIKVLFGSGSLRSIDAKRTKSATKKQTWKKQKPGTFVSSRATKVIPEKKKYLIRRDTKNSDGTIIKTEYIDPDTVDYYRGHPAR